MRNTLSCLQNEHRCSWDDCSNFFCEPSWAKGAFLSTALTNHILMARSWQRRPPSSPLSDGNSGYEPWVLFMLSSLTACGQRAARSQVFNPDNWLQALFCLASAWARNSYRLEPLGSLGNPCLFWTREISLPLSATTWRLGLQTIVGSLLLICRPHP